MAFILHYSSVSRFGLQMAAYMGIMNVSSTSRFAYITIIVMLASAKLCQANNAGNGYKCELH